MSYSDRQLQRAREARISAIFHGLKVGAASILAFTALGVLASAGAFFVRLAFTFSIN